MGQGHLLKIARGIEALHGIGGKLGGEGVAGLYGQGQKHGARGNAV